MSVDEFATHASSSLPAGKSRLRPGRFIVSTSQRRSVLVVSSAVIVGLFVGYKRFVMLELAMAKALWVVTGVTSGSRQDRADARGTILLQRRESFFWNKFANC